jgi:hypothetical protein
MTARHFVVIRPEGQVERPAPAGLVVVAVTRNAIGPSSLRPIDQRVMAFAALPNRWHQHVIGLGAPPCKLVARRAIFSSTHQRFLAPRRLRTEAMAQVAKLTAAEPSLGNVRRGDLPRLLGTLDGMAVPAAGRGPGQDAVGIPDLPVDPIPLRLRRTTRPSRYGASDPSVVALQVAGILADELRVTLADQPTQQFGLDPVG